MILVGLYELLIEHGSGPQALDYLSASLATLKDLEVYGYLVITLLSRHDPELTSLVVHAGRLETNRERMAVLLTACELFSADKAVAGLLERLGRRTPPPSNSI